MMSSILSCSGPGDGEAGRRPVTKSTNGLGQAFPNDGFQKIVEDIHLKGADGIPVKGDDKDIGHMFVKPWDQVEPASPTSLMAFFDCRSPVASVINLKPCSVKATVNTVVKGVNLLAEAFREKGVPVIWIRQNFTRTSRGDDVGLYGHFHKKPVPSGMYNQGALTEIHPAMRVMPEDHVVFKNRYSLFAPGSSTLEVLLEELGRDQLVFCGVVTNVCVECSVRDAMQRGFQSTVISDATTSFDPLVHEISLQIMKLFFADIGTVHEIITLLSSL